MVTIKYIKQVKHTCIPFVWGVGVLFLLVRGEDGSSMKLHPKVEAFIRKWEEEAAGSGSYRKKLGPNEKAFLELVWGPEFDYRFEGLQPEHPLKDYKGGDRFADFTFVRGSLRLLIEIDDFETHGKAKSSWDFDDHLLRQNDLVLDGWTILRFSTFHVNKMPMVCRRQIKQAIGNWWVTAYGRGPFRKEGRKKEIELSLVELALRTDGGLLKPAHVARDLETSRTTAMKWLKVFADEGLFEPVTATSRVVGYKLRQV